MANRSTLAVLKLEDFKNWLIFKGWKIAETKDYFEVLRAVKEGRKNPLIVYKRLSTDNGVEFDSKKENASYKTCEILLLGA